MPTSLDEVKRLRRNGNVIPLFKSVIADFLTPVSAFLRIERGYPHAFLLESVEGGEHVARYSFLGCNPFRILRSADLGTDRFLEQIREVMSIFKAVDVEGLPPFTGGAVGYFGYDMIRTVEHLPSRHEVTAGSDDAVLMFFRTVLAFDHVRHQIHIVSNVIDLEGTDASVEAAYAGAIAEIEQIERVLRSSLDEPVPSRSSLPLEVRSNFDRSGYLTAVERAKEYIAAGDIFQVVLSQRFEVDVRCSSFDIYRALRIVNPSPYMYFIKMPETTVIGSSPEMLVRINGRDLEYRPIAGTLPRGRNAAEDEANERRLLADEKERAEHVMLVDLGRNDLGRVSDYGTVKVDKLMFIERYSHVMHIVSSLRGRLRSGLDRWDALMACFPAGTVSGAPKVRAMEIIDELEPSRRDVYAGAVLYADFRDNLDSCIAIRTLVVRGSTGHVQAGGGVVADSIPDNEYAETVNKAGAIIRAITLAQNGFES